MLKRYPVNCNLTLGESIFHDFLSFFHDSSKLLVDVFKWIKPRNKVRNMFRNISLPQGNDMGHWNDLKRNNSQMTELLSFLLLKMSCFSAFLVNFWTFVEYSTSVEISTGTKNFFPNENRWDLQSLFWDLFVSPKTKKLR